MFFRAAPVVVLTALLAQSVLATPPAPDCQPGNYLKPRPGHPNEYTCTPCGPGYISKAKNVYGCEACPAGQQDSNGHKECSPCPPGKYSTGGTTCQSCPAGKGLSPDKTSCTPCTGETYSTAGGTCTTCPAGKQANWNHTGCDKCDEGEFNPTAGAKCQKCPVGTFNNVEGATSCCTCCAGWFADQPGSRSCKQCNEGGKKFGPVGASHCDQCKKDRGTLPEYTTSCGMNGKTCPPTTCGGPQGSQIATKKRGALCPSGFTSCPRLSGQAGSDCVDTENDPESCGGCVGLEGEGSGTDCTAIQGTSATRCVKGSCVIDSCRKGFTKSIDGTSCVSSGSDGLHAQKRSSAKRAVRHHGF
ncbi:hypothetical protein FS837_010752 [Tulasnella sp. UAMH 9824]|nr:hypothetical protein FS837_010752 [Tulasnella sp. UAMH 9824]